MPGGTLDALSIGVGYMPDFTFSLPFIIIPHTTHYTTKQLHKGPTIILISLSFCTQKQIHIPHVTWSAQDVRESKIDHTNAIYRHSAEPETYNSAVG